MNHRAKFDAAGTALSPAEKSVSVQNDKITNKQTLTDISTLCLSACVEMTTNDWSWQKIVYTVRSTSITHINTNKPVAKGFLKTAPHAPVDHFALIGSV